VPPNEKFDGESPLFSSFSVGSRLAMLSFLANIIETIDYKVWLQLHTISTLVLVFFSIYARAMTDNLTSSVKKWTLEELAEPKLLGSPKKSKKTMAMEWGFPGHLTQEELDVYVSSLRWFRCGPVLIISFLTQLTLPK
jgi:hypothetical protein